MVLVLCIGDLHIPYRAADIPHKMKELLVPGKIQYILCTGNLCTREMLDYLRSLCPEVHCAMGEFDLESFPDRKTLKIDGFKFGIIHGHQLVPWGDLEALGIVARQMDVDVLVTGLTHQAKVLKSEDIHIMNPGSATGAFSPLESDVKASFILMDIEDTKATVYTYSMVSGKLKIDKMDITKS